VEINHIVTNGEELLEENSSPIFNDCPKIDGLVGNIVTNFLLDTGSQASIISMEIYEKLKNNDSILEEHKSSFTTLGPFQNSKKIKLPAKCFCKFHLEKLNF
jgi:hypothetical protein